MVIITTVIIFSWLTIAFKWLIADIMIQPGYYIAMILSMTGAYYTSEPKNRERGFGFLVWIVSNGYLLYGFAILGIWPMVIAYTYFQYCNIKGVYNNWYKKGGLINVEKKV